jgi:hypothetical protein
MGAENRHRGLPRRLHTFAARATCSVAGCTCHCPRPQSAGDRRPATGDGAGCRHARPCSGSAFSVAGPFARWRTRKQSGQDIAPKTGSAEARSHRAETCRARPTGCGACRGLAGTGRCQRS